jgi:hypothetical protein
MLAGCGILMKSKTFAASTITALDDKVNAFLPPTFKVISSSLLLVSSVFYLNIIYQE